MSLPITYDQIVAKNPDLARKCQYCTTVEENQRLLVLWYLAGKLDAQEDEIRERQGKLDKMKG